jgi:hypothetical protein
MKVAGEELSRRGIPHQMPQREEAGEPETGETITFETIAHSVNTSAMHILRARLEAEGIPAWIADANLNQVYLSGAASRARLMVPSKFSAAAKSIVADVRSGALALGDNVELTAIVGPTDKGSR